MAKKPKVKHTFEFVGGLVLEDVKYVEMEESLKQFNRLWIEVFQGKTLIVKSKGFLLDVNGVNAEIVRNDDLELPQELHVKEDLVYRFTKYATMKQPVEGKQYYYLDEIAPGQLRVVHTDCFFNGLEHTQLKGYSLRSENV
jgi:hypothetical protein